MKPNDNTKLLKMISTLQNRLDRVERKQTANACLYATQSYEVFLLANVEGSIGFEVPIYQEGILVRLNSANSGDYVVMSAGMYVISISMFLSPLVADAQVRLYISRDNGVNYFAASQMNMFGATGRTAGTVTFVQYFEEGDNFNFRMLVPTDTTIKVRTESQFSFKSPYISIVQVTGELDPVDNPNDWYGDDYATI